MIRFGPQKNGLADALSELEGLAFSSGAGADLDLPALITRERSEHTLTRAIDPRTQQGSMQVAAC